MSFSKLVLPIIVLSQFFCTSLWFAGNSVLDSLILEFGLHESSIGSLTSSVQLGFIIGTLLFAAFTLVDRFSPSKLFFICAVLGALANLGIMLKGNSLNDILLFRFLTGFFLAGVYPVGMKIASDYYDKGLGKALGYLVGALVLGTGFPHLLKGLLTDFSWRYVLLGVSSFATVGGALMLFFVSDGPFRKKYAKVDFFSFFKVFKYSKFRNVSFAYFGHMWELYTFWALVPFIIKQYNEVNENLIFNVPIASFMVIAIGGVACVVSGYLSLYFGNRKVAISALLLSAICCVLSLWMFDVSPIFFIIFLSIWGWSVIADSPLLSTLVAQNAPVNIKGTALTIVNSVGFTLTIISIQLFVYLIELTGSFNAVAFLSLGPILGLIFLIRAKLD